VLLSHSAAVFRYSLSNTTVEPTAKLAEGTASSVPVSDQSGFMENLIAKEAAAAVAQASGNRIRDVIVAWKDERLKSVKSWSAFADKAKFGLPKVTEIYVRIKANLSYFLSNYIILFFVLLVYCVITNPFFLFSIGISALLYFYMFRWRQEPISIGSYQATDRVKWGFLVLVSAFLFWYASVGNTIFWLIGATGFIVFVHALFYVPAEETDFDFSTKPFPTLPVTGTLSV